eukprot:3040947-Amphidinium_carterae.1
MGRTQDGHNLAASNCHWQHFCLSTCRLQISADLAASFGYVLSTSRTGCHGQCRCADLVVKPSRSR